MFTYYPIPEVALAAKVVLMLLIAFALAAAIISSYETRPTAKAFAGEAWPFIPLLFPLYAMVDGLIDYLV